jgi:hypothetical protein
LARIQELLEIEIVVIPSFSSMQEMPVNFISAFGHKIQSPFNHLPADLLSVVFPYPENVRPDTL